MSGEFFSSLGLQEKWFNGQLVESDDLAYADNSRISQERRRVWDFWTDGILQDPNGLSNMVVSVDGTTPTLFNVSHGVAYANGERIVIDTDLAYAAGSAAFTTNGICTPFSSGNRGIPLANYSLGQCNHVWAQYLVTTSTGSEDISTIDGSINYPQLADGYQILVTTANYPTNMIGLTNAVYLGTVFGQGAGHSLLGSPVGLTDAAKLYSQIRPLQSAITNIANGSITEPKFATGAVSTRALGEFVVTTFNIANGAVRGSTANIGGMQQEILQGTVSTPDIRAGAVTSTSIATATIVAGNIAPAGVNNSVIDHTDSYTINNLTITGNLNIIPAGTNMVFYQANVPVGWTFVGVNDYFLRSVSSGTTGGTFQTSNSPSGGLTHRHHSIGVGYLQGDNSTSVQDRAVGSFPFGEDLLSNLTGSGTTRSYKALFNNPNQSDGDADVVVPRTDNSSPKFSYADVVIGQK